MWIIREFFRLTFGLSMTSLSLLLTALRLLVVAVDALQASKLAKRAERSNIWASILSVLAGNQPRKRKKKRKNQ